MQARLQVWSGSSISTTGTRSLPHHQLASCHFIMSVAMWTGNRIEILSRSADAREPAVGRDAERIEPGAAEDGEIGAEATLRDPLLAGETHRARPPARAERQRLHAASHVDLAGRRVDDLAAGKADVVARFVQHDLHGRAA